MRHNCDCHTAINTMFDSDGGGFKFVCITKEDETLCMKKIFVNSRAEWQCEIPLKALW